MSKRYRIKKLQRGVLSSYYGKSEDGEIDVCFANGPGCDRADARLVANAFCSERLRPSLTNYPYYESDKSFLDELEERGYDITTLKFSIKKKVA